jgi:uncharacterized protein
VFLIGVLRRGDPAGAQQRHGDLLLGLANALAALGFVAFRPVRWTTVLHLAVGFLIGGRIGPAVVRRARGALPACSSRFAGVGLAFHLALDAYRW